MMVWVKSILTGMELYKMVGMALFVPVTALAVKRTGKFNPLRGMLNQLLVCYLCCLFALVFLPLPTLAQAGALTYRCQLVPGYFLYDLVKKPCLSAVAGVLFNVLMTVPFGMYLRYCGGFDKKKVLLFSFALTMVIEVGQLTGLFFLFRGSYRLFDVDDLLCNTLGGYLGYVLVRWLERFLPSMERFDLAMPAWGLYRSRRPAL